jgi:uncharacterized membrane-anchored protein YitT (DUF2179 family)
MKGKITKASIKKFLVDLLFIGIGCAVGAFATVGILIPNGLTSGGLTGAVRIIQMIIPLDFSILYYLGALIILLACLLLLGMKEARKIVLLTILYPTFLVVFERLDFMLLEQKDIILAAVYVGVFSGIGSGLVLSRGYSFGGSDTVAKIIHKRALPFVSLSKVMLVIDATIILGSGVIFGRNIALYALVSQVIFTKMVDFVIYGFDSKLVQVEIIPSTGHNEIASYIVHELGRGVSNVTIRGEYSKEEKRKIITICSPNESMQIKDMIARIDRNAFVSIVHVEAVWGQGEGFINIYENN